MRYFKVLKIYSRYFNIFVKIIIYMMRFFPNNLEMDSFLFLLFGDNLLEVLDYIRILANKSNILF